VFVDDDTPELPHAVFKDHLIVIHAAPKASRARGSIRLEEARADGRRASVASHENNRLCPPVKGSDVRGRDPGAATWRPVGNALSPYVEAAERNFLVALEREELRELSIIEVVEVVAVADDMFSRRPRLSRRRAAARLP
jgi:hypothetical protein